MGIQMTQKDLTKTFMMISNWTKPFGLHGIYKTISALWKKLPQLYCLLNAKIRKSLYEKLAVTVVGLTWQSDNQSSISTGD